MKNETLAAICSACLAGGLFLGLWIGDRTPAPKAPSCREAR